MTPTDDELLRIWQDAGGYFCGPEGETGYIAEEKLLPFLRYFVQLKQLRFIGANLKATQAAVYSYWEGEELEPLWRYRQELYDLGRALHAAVAALLEEGEPTDIEQENLELKRHIAELELKLHKKET